MSVHVPVMLQAVLDTFLPQPGQIFVDGTLGGGGHTLELAKRVAPNGQVVAVDRDPQAVAQVQLRLASWPVTTAVASYDELPEVLGTLGIDRVDGILLDLGLSSDQLSDPDRGFSFHASGELDMRFDASRGEPAWQWLQYVPEHELARVIFEYGEERFSRRIARRLVQARQQQPLRHASQVAELVRNCVPRSKNHAIDPATRTFQALRIAINDELGILHRALQRLPSLLKPGGRIAVISFHSLEDRIVKRSFKEDKRFQAISKKPILPDNTEISANSRARSAKMRVAQVS